MMLKTFALFALTALAEIVGCWLPWLWLRKGGSVWLLLPAAVALALFAWLLTLHPTASGRTYAAYGGVYVSAGVAVAGGRHPSDTLGCARCGAVPGRDGCDHTWSTPGLSTPHTALQVCASASRQPLRTASGAG